MPWVIFLSRLTPNPPVWIYGRDCRSPCGWPASRCPRTPWRGARPPSGSSRRFVSGSAPRPKPSPQSICLCRQARQPPVEGPFPAKPPRRSAPLRDGRELLPLLLPLRPFCVLTRRFQRARPILFRRRFPHPDTNLVSILERGIRHGALGVSGPRFQIPRIGSAAPVVLAQLESSQHFPGFQPIRAQARSSKSTQP